MIDIPAKQLDFSAKQLEADWSLNNSLGTSTIKKEIKAPTGLKPSEIEELMDRKCSDFTLREIELILLKRWFPISETEDRQLVTLYHNKVVDFVN